VARYTLVFLGADGHVEARREVDARDDDQAIDLAGESDHLHVIEVRQDERIVARFPERRRRPG
jgi:hypothetical protein